MTARKLSERETAVLRAILEAAPQGASGVDLVISVRGQLGSISPMDIVPAGVHRTAASLVRKNLAWRDKAGQTVIYRMTQTGRRALEGDQAGKWVAR